MNAEVASDIPVQKLEVNEECTVDSSVRGDLQSGCPGNCNDVKLEGAVREVVSGNGKEETDGAYVFINGIVTASEESVEQNSLVLDPNESSVGRNGVVKLVNGRGNCGDFEEPVTADRAVQCQHHEGVTFENGHNNSLEQAPTEEFVENNAVLKVNGCNGVGDFGVQVTEEKAIEVQPFEDGLSKDSCATEVKPETEVMASVDKLDGLESDGHGEYDCVGVGIIVEEHIAPEEIPESNESCDVAAHLLVDRKDRLYENAAEVSNHVSEAPNAEPAEIAESHESSYVVGRSLSHQNESLENAGEISDHDGEVPKAEPEDIPDSHESRDAAASVLRDRVEPLENAGEVSDQVNEVPNTEPQEAESYESSDVDAPTLSDIKEPLENEREVPDQVDEVIMTEPAIDDSISGDSELQKECGRISEPKVAEQEFVDDEKVAEKCDFILGHELTDSDIPSSSDVPLENVSWNSDQNMQMVGKSLESGESLAPYDSGHELNTSVMMQPSADATLKAYESKPDLVGDELLIGSAADILEAVQTPTQIKLTPASEIETAPSHCEPDIAVSVVKLESASTKVSAESGLILIKTESPVIEHETGSPSADEPSIREVTIKSLDLGREAKEHSASTDSLPSVDNGSVPDDTVDKADSPVNADVEDTSATVAQGDDGSGPISDNSGPSAELQKGQMLWSESSDMDLKRADRNASLVPNDISSSCNVTDGEPKICFGSISQKELSAQPTSYRNTYDLSSAVHAPSSEQELTKSKKKVERRFFNYLIKVPRYDDRDNLREQINAAQPEVDEKTRIRDAIKIEREKSRALRDELFKEVDAAIKEEDAARESLNSKREEVTHVQEMVKAAKSTDDIDSRIRSMEHTLHHVTIDLKEEKQIMREIKQLRQSREQLSSNLGKLSLEQREQNEGRLKILRKEEELLRDNVSRAELVTKTAKKNYYNEKNRFWELVDQFKAANEVRQDAYQRLKDLKDRLRKKEDRFFTYRKDQNLCFDLINNKQRDAVSDKCVQQVEELIKLWVDDSEFRDDYIRCNARSTLRRLGTSDGRDLGPNEERQNVPAYTPSNVRAPVKDISSQPLPSPRGPPPSVHVEALSTESEPEKQKKKHTASKANNAVKPSESLVVELISVREEVVEVAEELNRKNEEEEMARIAEDLRKEEEAAKLKEQRRLEEKAKAEAALKRKKRNAERAEARAAAKAQKEAELKEKERLKRLRKKERKSGVTDTSSEVESVLSSETSVETPKELETTTPKERGVKAVTKRPQKPNRFIKHQNRVKSIPPPLRKRGKRRIQPWMWGVTVVIVVLALTLVLFGRDLF